MNAEKHWWDGIGGVIAIGAACLVLGLMMIVAFGMSVGKGVRAAAESAKQSPAAKAFDLEMELTSVARRNKKVIERLLKHPTTARWEHPSGGSWMGDHEQVIYSGDRYGIRGRVIAKNSFGVETPHDYESIYHVSDGQFLTAELVELRFNGKVILKREPNAKDSDTVADLAESREVGRAATPAE